MATGKKSGLIPFVFIRTPLIEESRWSVLKGLDYYPTLSIAVGKFGTSMEDLPSEGVMIEADFDTGERKTTRILGKKSRAKKSTKRK